MTAIRAFVEDYEFLPLDESAWAPVKIAGCL